MRVRIVDVKLNEEFLVLLIYDFFYRYYLCTLYRTKANIQEMKMTRMMMVKGDGCTSR